MAGPEGEACEVLGSVKRAFSRSRKARGPSPGALRGQEASCLSWGLLCTWAVEMPMSSLHGSFTWIRPLGLAAFSFSLDMKGGRNLNCV